MHRSLLTTGVILLATIANAGCGLLLVPYTVTLPREPLRHVQVLDFNTRQPLAAARVSFHVTQYDNWVQPAPTWGVSDSPDQATPATATSQPNECVASCEALRQDSGLFEITARSRCAWVQVWCPLPPVLGCFLYHTYDGIVVVSAAGYKTVWFSNSVEAECGPRDAEYDGPDLPDGVYVDVQDTQVDVFLPRGR